MLQKIWSNMGKAYRAEVGKRLASRGLLYEDLLIETDDVKLALSRLPKDVLAAREQRLKRALVLGSQQRYLPDEVADKIDPFEKYLGARRLFFLRLRASPHPLCSASPADACRRLPQPRTFRPLRSRRRRRRSSASRQRLQCLSGAMG